MTAQDIARRVGSHARGRSVCAIVLCETSVFRRGILYSCGSFVRGGTAGILVLQGGHVPLVLPRFRRLCIYSIFLFNGQTYTCHCTCEEGMGVRQVGSVYINKTTEKNESTKGACLGNVHCVITMAYAYYTMGVVSINHVRHGRVGRVYAYTHS